MRTIETALLRSKKRLQKPEWGTFLAANGSAIAAVVAAFKGKLDAAWLTVVVVISTIAMVAAWRKLLEARSASDEHLEDAIEAATQLRLYFDDAQNMLDHEAMRLVASNGIGRSRHN
jgi:hypothetical protein